MRSIHGLLNTPVGVTDDDDGVYLFIGDEPRTHKEAMTTITSNGEDTAQQVGLHSQA